MDVDVIERRQQRRADLRAQIVIKILDGQGEDHPVIGRVKNVSLSGAYAYVPTPFNFPSGTALTFSVSIPQESARQFPFVRLLGKGWIVRVDQPQQDDIKKRKPVHKEKEFGSGLTQEILGSGEDVGVAIGFTRDVTALGSIGTS